MTESSENPNIESLMADLTCDNVIRCQKARRTLVSMGPEAVPSLMQALRSDKTWVRWEALTALSQIDDPQATMAQLDLLDSPDFDLRWIAAKGLIKRGRNIVIPLLEMLQNRDYSTALFESAHHILHDMWRGKLDAILHPVMAALEDMDPRVHVPIAARRALEAIRELEILEAEE
jgi:hypothetical protein